MSSISYHNVKSAPAPVAPYHHAVEADGWLYVTGQLPIDPYNDGAPLPEGIVAQTELVFKNIQEILDQAGYKFTDAVYVRMFLTRFHEDFAGMNTVYTQYFERDTLPARTTVGVAALGRDALVEIDMVLYRGK